MSFVNILKPDPIRTTHAHIVVDHKTMIDNRKELFHRDDGVFLEYNFNNLKSKYNKDLFITEGGVSFSNGEVIFNLDHSCLGSQLNTFYPKQNFMTKVLCTLPNNSVLTISLGDTEIVIDPFMDTFGGQFLLTDSFSSGFLQSFPDTTFKTHVSYKDGGENEYSVVFDNSASEIAFLMNGHKLSYISIDPATTLNIDIKESLKIISSKSGARLNQFEILHSIPTSYVVQEQARRLKQIEDERIEREAKEEQDAISPPPPPPPPPPDVSPHVNNFNRYDESKYRFADEITTRNNISLKDAITLAQNISNCYALGWDKTGGTSFFYKKTSGGKLVIGGYPQLTTYIHKTR
jgi:hypothetical protein